MFERPSDRARKVLALANQEAQRFNHEYVGTEHILLGLVKEGCGIGATTLENLDVDLRRVRLEVEKLIKSGPEMSSLGKLPQTPRAKKVIEYALEEARSLNHNYVGTEHLLLGILREHDGIAATVLRDSFKLKLEEVREEVLCILAAKVEEEDGGSAGENSPDAVDATPLLSGESNENQLVPLDFPADSRVVLISPSLKEALFQSVRKGVVDESALLVVILRLAFDRGITVEFRPQGSPPTSYEI